MNEAQKNDIRRRRNGNEECTLMQLLLLFQNCYYYIAVAASTIGLEVSLHFFFVASFLLYIYIFFWLDASIIFINCNAVNTKKKKFKTFSRTFRAGSFSFWHRTYVTLNISVDLCALIVVDLI